MNKASTNEKMKIKITSRDILPSTDHCGKQRGKQVEKADVWLAQMPSCEEKCTFSLPNNPRLIYLIYSRFPFPLLCYIITNGYNALLPVAWLPVFCFCSLPIVSRHYLCGQHITFSRYFFPKFHKRQNLEWSSLLHSLLKNEDYKLGLLYCILRKSASYMQGLFSKRGKKYDGIIISPPKVEEDDLDVELLQLRGKGDLTEPAVLEKPWPRVNFVKNSHSLPLIFSEIENDDKERWLAKCAPGVLNSAAGHERDRISSSIRAISVNRSKLFYFVT